MTYTCDGGDHVFHCDSCPECIEPEAQETFDEAWAEAKAEGWEVFKMRGEWTHTCPDCSED